MGMSALMQPLLGETQSLLNTESVLFIDDDECEFVKLHSVLEKRVGADDQLQITSRDSFKRTAPRSSGL
jgi:hypothetical protein